MKKSKNSEKKELASSADRKGTFQDTAPQGRMDLLSMGDWPPPSKAAQVSLTQQKNPRRRNPKGLKIF